MKTAAEINEQIEAAKREREETIAELRRQRDEIDAQLAALGAKRSHKKAEPKRGRPRGSKNLPAETPEVQAVA